MLVVKMTCQWNSWWKWRLVLVKMTTSVGENEHFCRWKLLQLVKMTIVGENNHFCWWKCCWWRWQFFFSRSSPEVYDSADDHCDWHHGSNRCVAVRGRSFAGQLCGGTVHQLPELSWVCRFLWSAQLLPLHHGICLLALHKCFVWWVNVCVQLALLYHFCVCLLALHKCLVRWVNMCVQLALLYCRVCLLALHKCLVHWVNVCVQLALLHHGICLFTDALYDEWTCVLSVGFFFFTMAFLCSSSSYAL